MPEDGIIKSIIKMLIDAVPVLLIVVGIVVFVLGAAGGVTFHGWFPITEKEWKIVVALGGVVIFVLGITYQQTNVNLPRAANHRIKITYPNAGIVGDPIDVGGTIKKMPPDGYELWVLKIYSNDKFTPVRKATIDIENNAWVAHSCSVGGKPGETRDLGAYLVGPSGAALINYYRSAADLHKQTMEQLRASSGNQADYLPAISARTLDMIECARVSVSARLSAPRRG